MALLIIVVLFVSQSTVHGSTNDLSIDWNEVYQDVSTVITCEPCPENFSFRSKNTQTKNNNCTEYDTLFSGNYTVDDVFDVFKKCFDNSNNETDNKKKAVSNCGNPKFLCRSFFSPLEDSTYLWDRSSVIGPNEMTDTDLLRSCHCDERCIEYGDCCIDAASYWSNSAAKTQNWKCAPLNRILIWNYRMEHDLGAQGYIYMIADCPEGDARSTACHRQVDDKDYTYLMDISVLSLKTNITYANIYCAKCNNDADYLAQWDVNVDCTVDYYENITKASNNTAEIISKLQYQRGELRWRLPHGWKTPEFSAASCSIEVKQFSNITEYVQMSNGRRCIPSIDTCPPDSDTSDQLKCQSPYALIQGFFTFSKDYLMGVGTFKNLHCARCNEQHPDLAVKLEDLRCPLITLMYPMSGVIPHGGFAHSFQLVLDLNPGGGDHVGLQRRCQGHGIWDHVHQRCQPMSCGDLYELRDSTCILRNIDESLNNTSSEVLMDPSCPRINLSDQDFHFNEDGLLVLNETGQTYNSSQFERINGSVQICAEDHYYFNYSEAQSYLSVVCLGISVACLALHIIIHSLIPKLRNLPGKILLSLCCALLGAQLLFLTASKKTELGQVCSLLAALTHWFFLASFFWMNVMGVDICRTFSSRVHRSGNRNSTFVYYSIYAWGCPTLIVLGALIVHFTLPESMFSPNYGAHVCWISSRMALALFFALPVALLLLANIGLFIRTVCSIVEQKKAAKFAVDKKEEGSDSTTKKNNHNNTVRFVLYIKLALIMGLGWLFAFIASVNNLQVLWYPFIFFNGLQGLFIFVAFNLKKKIYRLLWELVHKKPFPTSSVSSTKGTTTYNVSSRKSKDENKFQD